MKHILKMENSKTFRKYRLRELYHFKALVIFVFTVYGILIPLWFAFHGNKILGNNDQWTKIVSTTTRIARSHSEPFHDTNNQGRQPEIHKNYMKRHGMRGAKRRSQRHLNATGPKPLHRFDTWPQPRRQNRANRNPGRLLSMKWDHLCCQSINCLRKFPLFPRLPTKKKFVKRLRVSEKGQLYGQRISGLLKPPESGIYAFYMKCLITCEFWLSDNEYPLRGKLLKKVVRGVPVEHRVNAKNNTKGRTLIFTAYLQTDRAYFMDVLLTVYRYIKRPFEVFWKTPNNNNFQQLSKEFFTGFNKNPESLKSVLRLYSHSPSVMLTPFLESIEEPGDDDADLKTLGEENQKANYTFMDSEGHPIFVNSSLGSKNELSFLRHDQSSSFLPLCEKRVQFNTVNTTLAKYSGVWKTSFTSVYPKDNTGYMKCIGNRYPDDCQGNKVMSRDVVSKVLTFYSKALRYLKIRNPTPGNQANKMPPGESLKIHQLVSIHEKADTSNGSLLMMDAILRNPLTNKTFHDSQYLYMNKNRSSFCIPKGYTTINSSVTVTIIVVAKRQTNWLRHFLANLEKVFVTTKDKHMNVIIAKYGSKQRQLMEEYRSSRLPSIRTIRLHGVFDKRRAIQSAVTKIKDQNSIIFLMDLHIIVPHNIIQLVRTHTIQGHMVFNPVLFRLSHCGSPASSTKPPRGFWETFGYGILGIYKSDWDKLGKIRTKKYKEGWGGEDWELLDRVIAADLDVQRLRVEKFYHFYHSKKGMWH